MEYPTTRFGKVEVAEDQKILFPLGILGFPDCRHFTLIPHPKGGPCQWLQSLEVPDLALVICEPQIFVPEYRIDIRLEELRTIAVTSLEEARVFVIMRVPPKPEPPTINLVGPLFFNILRKLGMQYVCNGSPWSHRHKIEVCSS